MTMKPLSFKITSHHFLLCVLQTLLWGVTDSNNTSIPTTTLTTVVTELSTTPMTTLSTTQPAPNNTEEFKSIGQNETSITLQWKKVDAILDYTLQYSSEEINVTALAEDETVTYIASELKSGTEYVFTLFTVFGNVRSTGVNLTAVTAPPDVKQFKSIRQNETSITLQWNKVDAILDYTLQYSNEEIHVNALAEDETVTYIASELKSGTEYVFTLFTVFENVRSTGVNLTAVTAPDNTEEFKSVGQNETSITLQWKKVDAILDYTLQFNNTEINVTASAENKTVTYVTSELKSGSEYVFTLFTVFENVRSTGVNLTAVTAPDNTEEFKSVGQNETSIILQWKKVDAILDYTLQFNNTEINVTASAENKTVTYVTSELKSGSEYVFTLFTVFENVRSTGVNLTAVTAPDNTEEFKSVGQNETSITLQWKKVDAILDYTLQFNNTEINVTASAENETVTYVTSELKSGTEYVFTLFTVFGNVQSTGVNLTAVTAPDNTEEFKSVGQNETSITLQWKKVDAILDYTLQFNKTEINVTASAENETVTYIASELKSGTKHIFTLFTVFGSVSSIGVNLTAVTVPPKVPFVNVTERSVDSLTLMWDNVDRNWNYLLQINGSNLSNITNVSSDVVSHSITSLKPGTMYKFTVITVFYELHSTAYEDFIVTAIDCASVAWHVSNSSIQAMVKGLFSNATASNGSDTHVSLEGNNVTFTGLYPGATYEVSLVYKTYQQCRHNLTVLPPGLSAHCEYWEAGYSIRVAWNKPDGVWNTVEVNVTGQTYITPEQYIVIDGFLPAKTYEVSLASLSGTRSSVPFVFQCSTDPRGVIAGSVLAVLLLCVLVFLAVFILFIRPDLIRKKTFISGTELTTKKCNAISVKMFAEHFYQLSMDDNRGFTVEYESLIPVGTEQTQKAAILPENREKNRFNNVLPYDWCRVKLTTSGSSGTSDYINANYMPGYNANREYIATQGPLPTTVSDFWRMIWEQGVGVIVMVTNCTEGGRTKCEQYWPANRNSCLYGELLVTMTSEQQEPDWTLREFNVKHKNTSEQHTVKHFHFTSWPDHGVPQGTKVLIQFRGLVRQHIEREGIGAPTVVHCSAGVGRTGTIITLDVLLQQLEKKAEVDINGFVHKMRLNRPHMVQTESQYIFLHQCIMDSLQPEEKTDEHIYENTDMIYVNASALQEFRNNSNA